MISSTSIRPPTLRRKFRRYALVLFKGRRSAQTNDFQMDPEKPRRRPRAEPSTLQRVAARGRISRGWDLQSANEYPSLISECSWSDGYLQGNICQYLTASLWSTECL